MVRGVKIPFVLLAITLAANGAASDPGQAAIEFLEKVRERKLNLEPGGDTALTPQTGEAKRRQIAKRIERLATELGSDPLEVGAVKLDENYAAVLVRKVGGFDPSRLRVFPVALVKRDNEWEAAPVPASFENAGAGYAIALRKRIEDLENWMLREQVLDLEKLRELSNARMRRKIEASLSEAHLKGLDAKMAGERFLSACESGDLGSVLGLFGGLGSKLPDDWPNRLRAAETAFAARPAVAQPWRLMVAPDVARIIVRNDDDGRTGILSVGCLDPAGTGSGFPGIRVIHFGMVKTADGLWQIDPPEDFLRLKISSAEDDAEHDDGEADDEPALLGNSPDSELIEEFPVKWLAAHPPAIAPNAEAAAQAWLSAARSGSFQAFLSTAKLDGAPGTAVKSCSRAAQIWWTLRSNTQVDFAAPLASKIDESRATVIYQFFAARDSDKFDPRTVYFEKSARGWQWTPEPNAAAREAMQPWVEEETKRLQDGWQQQLASSCPTITDIADLEAPSEKETRDCVESWLKAIHQGDVEAAIGLIACLGDPRSRALALQNLGYEISTSRGKPTPPPITSIHRGRIWSAAAAVIRRDGGKSIHPLYPVVKTPLGPRVLVEIDLFASDNRSRDYLNEAAIQRLVKATSGDAGADLRALLKEHLTQVNESSR